MPVDDPNDAAGERRASDRRIAFLDVLRVFAFASVVAGHQFFAYLDQASRDPGAAAATRGLAGAILPLVWGGGAGVVVFFLVSGYIITHVLQVERTASFLVKRLFRIYPLYWAAILVEALVHALDGRTVDASPATWLPRLFLLGDLFNTPYALNNVEWTLRIEILFYVLMALWRGFVFPRAMRWLPLMFVAVAAMLALLPPIPDLFPWSRGFTTLFLPFLFIGANVYLAERRLVSMASALASSLAILGLYATLRPLVNPVHLEYRFEVWALAIFAAAWLVRQRIPPWRSMTLLASLTYGVYLFHNWSWEYLAGAFTGWVSPGLARDALVFVLLLAVCAVFHLVVEKPGIRVGQRIARRIDCARAPAPPLSRED